MAAGSRAVTPSGSSRWADVADAGHQLTWVALSPIARPCARPAPVNLGSSVTGDDQDWHLESGQPVPQRLLGAGPGQPQARRQPDGVLAPPLGHPGDTGGDAGEERVGQPALQEGVDTILLDRRDRGRLSTEGRARRPVPRRPPPGHAGAVSSSIPAVPEMRMSEWIRSGLRQGGVEAESEPPSSSPE